MFIHDLSDTERSAMLTIVEAFADVDGITDGEARHLSYLESRFGVAARRVGWREVLPDLTTKKARVATLIEVLTVGWIDGRMSHQEFDLLDDLCYELGFEEADRAAYERWVRDHIDLVKRAEEFWA